jgi:hypothetical protein
MVDRTCIECGKPFQVPYPSSKRKTCSYQCRTARMSGSGKRKTRADKGTRKKWVCVSCANCGAAFDRPEYEVRASERKGWLLYCTPECKDAGGRQPWRGRPRDESKGRYVDPGGYVYIYVPPDERPPGKRRDQHAVSYYKEHRIVMARLLGRHLDRHETVHHINGDRTDNRPENLQLRNCGHGKGGVLRCRACGSHDIEHVEL